MHTQRCWFRSVICRAGRVMRPCGTVNADADYMWMCHMRVCVHYNTGFCGASPNYWVLGMRTLGCGFRVSVERGVGSNLMLDRRHDWGAL